MSGAVIAAPISVQGIRSCVRRSSSFVRIYGSRRLGFHVAARLKLSRSCNVSLVFRETSLDKLVAFRYVNYAVDFSRCCHTTNPCRSTQPVGVRAF